VASTIITWERQRIISPRTTATQ